MFRTCHRGAPSVRDIGTPPPLGADLVAEIEAAWQEARAEVGSQLFNGKLFSVAEIRDGNIGGRFIDYMWFIAAQRRPRIALSLNIKPLAVTGILRCRDGIVFGRRSRAVVQDKGLWELAPSGGISASCVRDDGVIDFTAQILEELREETAIQGADVVRTRPLCVIEDVASPMFDIIVEIFTALTASQVKAYAARASREYDQWEVVPVTEVTGFANQQGAGLAPLSAYILQTLEDAAP